MAKLGGSWDDYGSGKVHKEKVVKKLARINGLRDLLSVWEKHESQNGHKDSDHKYVLELRAKLRCAQNQYEAMAP